MYIHIKDIFATTAMEKSNVSLLSVAEVSKTPDLTLCKLN